MPLSYCKPSEILKMDSIEKNPTARHSETNFLATDLTGEYILSNSFPEMIKSDQFRV